MSRWIRAGVETRGVGLRGRAFASAANALLAAGVLEHAFTRIVNEASQSTSRPNQLDRRNRQDEYPQLTDAAPSVGGPPLLAGMRCRGTGIDRRRFRRALLPRVKSDILTLRAAVGRGPSHSRWWRRQDRAECVVHDRDIELSVRSDDRDA